MPQLIVNISNQAILPQVRRVIKTLQGVDSVTTSSLDAKRLSATQKKQLARLKELELLENNWDDDGAIPMEAATVANVEALIKTGDAEMLKQWDIFPDTNGTVELQAAHRDAVISIGNKAFSYVYHGKNHDEMVSYEPMDISVLSHLIKRINKNG